MKSLDAISISTPDHWHVLIAIDAMNAGKDVSCEKPLTLKIEEGAALIDAVHKNKRVFQTGMQQRSGPHSIQQETSLLRRGSSACSHFPDNS